ncbi:hypothetical protein NL676_000717 [Syzygium grande]|nr:hypothetical protein NL676_000717 [Syzygium grande]
MEEEGRFEAEVAEVQAWWNSGWQCSSTHTPPTNRGSLTIPTTPMSREERARTPYVDYLKPIIADGDTGFGGMTATVKLCILFVEHGAAGVRFKDQSSAVTWLGSVMAAIVRGWAFAPHSDLIWMETSSPDLVECTKFAEGVKSMQSEIKLAYNLSPSFNWDASGMTNEQMREFIRGSPN